jgi:hypothetical protein
VSTILRLVPAAEDRPAEVDVTAVDVSLSPVEYDHPNSRANQRQINYCKLCGAETYSRLYCTAHRWAAQ